MNILEKSHRSYHFCRTSDSVVEKVNKAHSKLFSQLISDTKTKYLDIVSKWHFSSASLYMVEVCHQLYSVSILNIFLATQEVPQKRALGY